MVDCRSCICVTEEYKPVISQCKPKIRHGPCKSKETKIAENLFGKSQVRGSVTFDSATERPNLKPETEIREPNDQVL